MQEMEMTTLRRGSRDDIDVDNDLYDDNEALLFSGGRRPHVRAARWKATAVLWAQMGLQASIAISVLVLAANSGGGSGAGNWGVGPAAATTDPLDGLTPSFNATVPGLGGPPYIAAWCTGSKQGVVLSVPPAMLNKPFVMSNLIAKAAGTGDGMLHTPGSFDNPVYTFARSRDGLSLDMRRLQIDLRTSNPQYDALMADGAWTGWLKSFPIANPSNAIDPLTGAAVANILIDATDFALVRGFMIGDLPGNIQTGRVASCKSFPRNVEFEFEYAVNRPGEPTEPGTTASRDHDTIALSVSLGLLPDQAMPGRIKDDRIGFFTSKYTDIGPHDELTGLRPSQRVDRDVALINRWRLEKKDPSCNPAATGGQGCEPATPVLYYIDPTVPARWRPWFKRGVEVWQPAFAKAGWKDTPRAVLPGDPDWPADFSAGDIRYSTVSFAVSRDKTFSVGPSTVDPRSGEIVNADIGFAQEWVAAWTRDLSGHDWEGTARRRRSGRDMHTGTHTDTGTSAGTQARTGGEGVRHPEPLHGNHHINSRHTHCRRQQLLEDPSFGIARLAASVRGLSTSRRSGRPSVSDDVIGAGLADVTAHEVGHTLGLRHNFKGSSYIKLDQIQNTSYTSIHGLSSSVMDYISINIAADPEAQGDFFSGHRSVGEYDALAIAYGYTAVADQMVPNFELEALAAATATIGITFASDSDAALGEDPYAKRYDLSDDAVAWQSQQMDIAKGLREGLYARTVGATDDFLGIWEAEHTLMWHICRAAQDAATHIGAFDISRRHRNQISTARAPVVPATTASQEAAFAVVRRAFTESGLLLRDASSAADSAGSDRCDRASEGAAAWCQVSRESGSDYSLGSVDLAARRSLYLSLILDVLLEPARLDRVRRTSRLVARVGTPALTVADALGNITDAVFGEISCTGGDDGGGGAGNECAMGPLAVDSASWPVQTYFVAKLAEHASYTAAFGEVGAAAALQLRRLRNKLATVSDPAIDSVHGEFLLSTITAITKALGEAAPRSPGRS